MPIVSRFEASANKTPNSAPKRKRPAPLSIRLNDAERAQLVREAKGQPLSTYIKAKALGVAPVRLRRSGLSVEDRKALAQALALLGKSNLTPSLNQIARAVDVGVLPVTPETEETLSRSLRAVCELRRLLVLALGLQEANE
ncbi:hypothetical protein [Labrenzia sp. R5_0]|uniref:hypothetical protein n=1 Tax=Labrenzia sp. R5_0 TaxID=2821108 RepID=UPI001ADBEDD9|nr:hypothetical protein [Labrenzia sp. R5_0]MBO9461174.1 hypothetical protein [Labrenzia sp. R5_0]